MPDISAFCLLGAHWHLRIAGTTRAPGCCRSIELLTPEETHGIRLRRAAGRDAKSPVIVHYLRTASEFSAATTIGQPSAPLGTAGFQPEAFLKRALETRGERERERHTPRKVARPSAPGKRNGLGTWSVSARVRR